MAEGTPAPVPADAAVPARVRWRPLADAIDPRISACPNWPMLAGALDRAQRARHDVTQHLPELVAQAPLDDHRPARALTDRLVQQCPAAGLQLGAAARAADDRQRLQALRSSSTTARPNRPVDPGGHPGAQALIAVGVHRLSGRRCGAPPRTPPAAGAGAQGAPTTLATENRRYAPPVEDPGRFPRPVRRCLRPPARALSPVRGVGGATQALAAQLTQLRR